MKSWPTKWSPYAFWTLHRWNLNPKMHVLQTQPTVSPTLHHHIQRGNLKVSLGFISFTPLLWLHHIWNACSVFCLCNFAFIIFMWLHAHRIGLMQATKTWKRLVSYVTSLQKCRHHCRSAGDDIYFIMFHISHVVSVMSSVAAPASKFWGANGE